MAAWSRDLTEREMAQLNEGTSAATRAAAGNLGVTVDAVILHDYVTGERLDVWIVMAPLAWCQRPRHIGTFERQADADALAEALRRRRY